MFDIEILGYSFHYEHDKNKYPVVEMEARYEDDFLCMPMLEFKRDYDAYDWIDHMNDKELDDMIEDFVDELWKEFHKGIPKVYEIRLYITLPIRPNMWIRQHIDSEFKRCLDVKRDEDKFYRALSNSTFGLGIELDDSHCYMALPRGSSKLEAQMKMLENYIKTGKVGFVPNRDIASMHPGPIIPKSSPLYGKNAFIDETLLDEYTRTDIKIVEEMFQERAKEKIKEYEKMRIENVIFNDPATIVFWRDGSKTVVKAKDEPYDPEKGLAMAIAKKAYGNEGNYYNEFKKFIKDDVKEDNKNEQ